MGQNRAKRDLGGLNGSVGEVKFTGSSAGRISAHEYGAGAAGGVERTRGLRLWSGAAQLAA